MARGIDGMNIFRDDEDREHFLHLFARYGAKAGVRCYAWALMRNHYHLALRSSEIPLSVCMKPLNSRYASYYNKKYGRRGYLFQDRFKSVATQDQRYLEELIRYIHLNPLRARVCQNMGELDRYAWCGHSVLMGIHGREFQDAESVLCRFGTSPKSAREQYNAFVSAGMDAADDAFTSMVRNSASDAFRRAEPCLWVIGDPDFVKTATSRDRERKIRIARAAADGWDVQKVCIEVARQLDISPEKLLERGRSDIRSSARKIVAYLCYRQFDLPISSVARFFGVGQPSVSRMVTAGEKLVFALEISIKH